MLDKENRILCKQMLIIKMKRSQHQCWDAARGPGAEPLASLESVLQARVHGLLEWYSMDYGLDYIISLIKELQMSDNLSHTRE